MLQQIGHGSAKARNKGTEVVNKSVFRREHQHAALPGPFPQSASGSRRRVGRRTCVDRHEDGGTEHHLEKEPRVILAGRDEQRQFGEVGRGEAVGRETRRGATMHRSNAIAVAEAAIDEVLKFIPQRRRSAVGGGVIRDQPVSLRSDPGQFTRQRLKSTRATYDSVMRRYAASERMGAHQANIDPPRTT
jgi:hypothetical protein